MLQQRWRDPWPRPQKREWLEWITQRFGTLQGEYNSPTIETMFLTSLAATTTMVRIHCNSVALFKANTLGQGIHEEMLVREFL
jgi:hypothetical protein